MLFQSILLSLNESTRSDYGAGLLRFTQFCDLLAIPETHARGSHAALSFRSFWDG
jgi:hypothetical protein